MTKAMAIREEKEEACWKNEKEKGKKVAFIKG